MNGKLNYDGVLKVKWLLDILIIYVLVKVKLIVYHIIYKDLSANLLATKDNIENHFKIEDKSNNGKKCFHVFLVVVISVQ